MAEPTGEGAANGENGDGEAGESEEGDEGNEPHSSFGGMENRREPLRSPRLAGAEGFSAAALTCIWFRCGCARSSACHVEILSTLARRFSGENTAFERERIGSSAAVGGLSAASPVREDVVAAAASDASNEVRGERDLLFGDAQLVGLGVL